MRGLQFRDGGEDSFNLLFRLLEKKKKSVNVRKGYDISCNELFLLHHRSCSRAAFSSVHSLCVVEREYDS